MRLLNARTLELESFEGSTTPPYAILSHTWGQGEILFPDVQTDGWRKEPRKKGGSKVEGSCAQAQRDGWDYIWIDTCCIDKSSSAELSEAINSMFKWYEESTVCYAYLADVATTDDIAEFKGSRWFTRGWTLQELIAPRRVEFFDQSWRPIGSRSSLLQPVSEQTGIDTAVLDRGHHPECPPGTKLDRDGYCLMCLERVDPSCQNLLSTFSVANRMSWGAERQTTRPEDEAYCLLGIFDINMPLLYGEGRKAFLRLQEEIMRVSDDQSILMTATDSKSNDPARTSLLASRPKEFIHGRNSFLSSSFRGAESYHNPVRLMNHCVTTQLAMCQLITIHGRGATATYERRGIRLGILNCVQFSDDCIWQPAILLSNEDAVEGGEVMVRRERPDVLVKFTPEGRRSMSFESLGDTSVSVIVSEGVKIEHRTVSIVLRDGYRPWRPRQSVLLRPIVQPPDRTYAVRVSFPDSMGGLYLQLREADERWPPDVVQGLIVLDDGNSHGFVVTWGKSQPAAIGCRVLSWSQASSRPFAPLAADRNQRESLFVLLDRILTPRSRTVWEPLQYSKLSHTLTFDGLVVTAILRPAPTVHHDVYELCISISHREEVKAKGAETRAAHSKHRFRQLITRSKK